MVKTKKTVDGVIKKRGIRISEIQDRLVQRAIVRTIEPLLNKKFNLRNDASFAYLRRRGVRKAVIRMVSLYKKGNPFVFESDIKSFFDTVDREKLLKNMIFPSLPDDSLNALIEGSLTQEIRNLGDLQEDDWEFFPDSGIPQGGGLSPLFANVYLSKFDKEILDNGHGLIRYADDFIIMCKDKTRAGEAHKISQRVIETDLGLKLHPTKTKISQVTQESFEFLGIRYNGKRLWPSDNRIKKFKIRIREATEFRANENLRHILGSMKHIIEGWLSAYSFTDIDPLLPEIENYVKERVGVCAYRMGWLKKESFLTSRQYRFSGLPDIKAFVKAQRRSLTVEEKTIFGIRE